MQYLPSKSISVRARLGLTITSIQRNFELYRQDILSIPGKFPDGEERDIHFYLSPKSFYIAQLLFMHDERFLYGNGKPNAKRVRRANMSQFSTHEFMPRGHVRAYEDASDKVLIRDSSSDTISLYLFPNGESDYMKIADFAKKDFDAVENKVKVEREPSKLLENPLNVSHQGKEYTLELRVADDWTHFVSCYHNDFLNEVKVAPQNINLHQDYLIAQSLYYFLRDHGSEVADLYSKFSGEEISLDIFLEEEHLSLDKIAA